MATATEEVLADLVDRAIGAVEAQFGKRLGDYVAPKLRLALLPVLEEALFLGEARTSLDSETAREELRRLLEEFSRLPPHFELVVDNQQLDMPSEQEFLQRLGRAQQSQAVMLPRGTTVHALRPRPSFTVISRLLWLLDLSEGERGFVRAAADEPCDLDGLSVFADWLEEQQRGNNESFREVALAGIRRLNPQPGEVYAVRLPSSQLPEINRRLIDSLLDYWKGQRNGAVILFLPHGHDISLLTDEQLAAAGLVRKDGLAERDKQGIKKHTGP